MLVHEACGSILKKEADNTYTCPKCDGIVSTEIVCTHEKVEIAEYPQGQFAIRTKDCHDCGLSLV